MKHTLKSNRYHLFFIITCLKINNMQLIEINNGTSLFLVKYGGDEIRFFSKPGILNWDPNLPFTRTNRRK